MARAPTRSPDVHETARHGSARRRLLPGFSSSPEGSEGKEATASRTLGTYDVGVIPRQPWDCPSGSQYIQSHMDDEDDGNDNYRWGWGGATQQNSSGTTFGFCRVDGERFGALPRASWVDLTAQSYAVLKLGSNRPPGTCIEFTRNFDNEDKNNRNWRQGNIGPNVSNSNTSLRFCMFMPSNSGVMNGFPSLGGEYGVFAAGGFAPF